MAVLCIRNNCNKALDECIIVVCTGQGNNSSSLTGIEQSCKQGFWQKKRVIL